MRIREGNDFNVAWKIFQAGVAVDLSQVTEKKLTFSVFGKKTEYTNYTVSGQTLMIEFPKEVTTVKGDYRLIFEYTIPDNGQSDGDLKRTTDVVAFRIVPFTADADADMTVNVSSDVAIAFKGDKGDRGYDAYHIWLDLGNTGTYEDYIAWLRQPATDAAESLSEFEQTVAYNEELRATAESYRVDAEDWRNHTEVDRITAEGIREANETARINAESNRADAEDLRDQAEVAREEAEGLRQTNTNTAIQNAGLATTAANTAAGLANNAAAAANTAAGDANNAAEAANTAAGLANNAAEAASTAAGLANNAATAANTAAGLADEARLAIQADLSIKIESEIYSETEYNEI